MYSQGSHTAGAPGLGWQDRCPGPGGSLLRKTSPRELQQFQAGTVQGEKAEYCREALFEIKSRPVFGE